jgi:hypothetical protein
MKLDGKIFNGSDSIYVTNRLLQSRIGKGIWLTEYIPRNYDKHFIEILLSQLCLMGLCCVISGPFAAFTAEIFDWYNIITLYIAITDSIILVHILGSNGMGPNFTIDSCIFI